MRSLPVNYIEQFVFAPLSTYFQQKYYLFVFSKFTIEGPIHLYSNMASSFRIFPYIFVNTRNLSTVYVRAPPTAIPLLGRLELHALSLLCGSISQVDIDKQFIVKMLLLLIWCFFLSHNPGTKYHHHSLPHHFLHSQLMSSVKRELNFTKKYHTWKFIGTSLNAQIMKMPAHTCNLIWSNL